MAEYKEGIKRIASQSHFHEYKESLQKNALARSNSYSSERSTTSNASTNKRKPKPKKNPRKKVDNRAKFCKKINRSIAQLSERVIRVMALNPSVWTLDVRSILPLL